MEELRRDNDVDSDEYVQMVANAVYSDEEYVGPSTSDHVSVKAARCLRVTYTTHHTTYHHAPHPACGESVSASSPLT